MFTDVDSSDMEGKKRLVNLKNPWELCSVLFWFSVESLLTDCGETVGESVRAHLRSKFHRRVSQGANCTYKVHFHFLKATFQTWLRSRSLLPSSQLILSDIKREHLPASASQIVLDQTLERLSGRGKSLQAWWLTLWEKGPSWISMLAFQVSPNLKHWC